MTTPPKRFPLPLAEVMALRQRKAPTLDKASRASPAGAPPAAMTRPPASSKGVTGNASATDKHTKPAPAGSANAASPGGARAANGQAVSHAKHGAHGTAGKPAVNGAHGATHASLRAATTPMAGASARPQAAVKAQTPKPIAPKALANLHASQRPGAGSSARKPVVPAVHPTVKPTHKPVGAGTAAPVARRTPAGPGQTAIGKVPADGMGLVSDRVRARMAERVAASGVKHPGVLAALATVPRHGFVDVALANQAYEDAALPIGHGQTISKPSVVGRMIELMLAGSRPLEKVLEIGTGCGYQAAVLACVAKDVYSIERVRPLHERAKDNLRPLRVPNIRLHYGDGRLGLPAVGPFDGIIIAAAGLEVPQALLEQLAIGARLVAPVGAEQQILTLIERTGAQQWRETRLDRVLFVPLKSGII